MVAHLHSGIILFAECFILNIWQCSEYVCLNKCSVICIVILCYVLYQTHAEFWHILQFVFPGICLHIQSYSVLLRHIHTYLDITKAYSGLFRHTQHTVSASHIYNLAIFWALAYLELQAYLKTYETLTRHIQNPSIEHSVIFRHIQNLVQHLHTQKLSIIEILAYSERFHNCILKHIQNPVISTETCKYSELWHI